MKEWNFVTFYFNISTIIILPLNGIKAIMIRSTAKIDLFYI